MYLRSAERLKIGQIIVDFFEKVIKFYTYICCVKKNTKVMNLNKRVIVGIKGHKGSGKDTIASMIHYIMVVGTTAATYDGWERYDTRPKYELDVPTIHFADKLKDDLSLMFGIPRECFDSQEYKDDKYFHFKTTSFKTAKNLREFPTPEITLKDLEENNLAKWVETYNEECVIKIRTLMQYYGTEIIRNQLGHYIWVKIGVNTALKHRDYYGYAVIADVRFHNESQAIWEVGGKLIYIQKDNKKKVEHSSEAIIKSSRDYVIDNNGTKLGLFYKVLEFVKAEMV